MNDGNPTGRNDFYSLYKAYTGTQTVRTSRIGSMQCKLGEDGRKEDEALDVRGEAQADLGAISDSRILFNPAVSEYSAGIAGQHGCSFFFNCLLYSETRCIVQLHSLSYYSRYAPSSWTRSRRRDGYYRPRSGDCQAGRESLSRGIHKYSSCR